MHRNALQRQNKMLTDLQYAAKLSVSIRGQANLGVACMDEIDDRFLRIHDVVSKTGRSRAAIYRMMAAGKFPKKVPIGLKAVGWRLSAVLRWMSDPGGYRSE